MLGYDETIFNKIVKKKISNIKWIGNDTLEYFLSTTIFLYYSNGTNGSNGLRYCYYSYYFC